MNIRSKTILSFFGFVFIPFILAGFLNYANASRELSAQIKDKLSLTATIQEKRINEILERYQDAGRQALAHIGILIDLPEYLSGGGNLKKKKMAEEGLQAAPTVFSEEMAGAALIGGDGELLATMLKPQAKSSYSVAFFLKNKSREQIAVDKFDDSVVLDYYFPIIQNGEFKGAFISVFKLDRIFGAASDYTGLGRTGETAIAFRNQNGDAEYFTPRRFAKARTIVKTEETNIPITQALLKNETFLTGCVDYRGEPVIAATRYIEKADWGLVVKEDVAEAFLPLSVLAKMSFLIVAAFLLISSIIIWLISRAIYKPLAKLKSAVNKIASGNLDIKISRDVLLKKDELGQLAQSFQKMVERLRALYGFLNERVVIKVKELANKIAETKNINQELLNAQTAILNVTRDLQIERDNLAEAKMKIEALCASIGDGMFSTDIDGKIAILNKAAERMFGLNAKDIIGKPLYNVISMEDEGGLRLPPEKWPIRIALRKGKIIASDIEKPYFFVKKDGTKLAVAITVTPIKINNKITGAVSIFRDISKAREIDRSKTEFVSLASHQLRTPLSAIKWYIEILKEKAGKKLNKEELDNLMTIYKSNEQMIAIINAFLNVSKIEMGTLSVQSVPSDIIQIADIAIKDLSREISEKKIELRKIYGKQTPLIKADPQLLGMILQNLLSNAVQYSGKRGKIVLEIKKEKNRVLVKIADNGIGIPKNQQERIFTKLFRADNAREYDPNGNGLGLYIIKSAIDRMGGKIWFKSEEKKGTVFYASFPLAMPRGKK